MSAQFAPALSQRRHWRVYVMGVEPDYVPVAEVRVWPSLGVPVIVGAAVLAGAAAATAAVAALVALPEPLALVAVTFTRIVLVTSAEVRRYVVPVAPEIPAQLAPALSQRCHARV
jgi:hypothetical protein